MADKEHEYWYDWEICGPDGASLIRLRESPPPIDKERLSDIDYLCERIYDYPEATLMNEDFWYRVVMLRQKAFKDEKYSEDLEKVCKAIAGDGHKRKSRRKIEELRI